MDAGAFGVGDFGFDGEPVEFSCPVALFDEDADVDFVAGAVDAAFGEDEGIEFGVRATFDASDIEAGEVEEAILTGVGHEGEIGTKAGDEGDGFFFVGGASERGEVDASIGLGEGGDEWDAIFSEDFDGDASEREACFDRGDEDVLAFFGIFFDDHSEIGDEDESLGGRRGGFVVGLPFVVGTAFVAVVVRLVVIWLLVFLVCGLLGGLVWGGCGSFSFFGEIF